MKTILSAIVATVLAMDFRVKTCWDIRIPSDYFCYDAVFWPISDEVFYEAEARDEMARESYAILK